VRSGPGEARTYYFISLVLGPLNSLVWYVPSLRYTRSLGWCIHCGVEVTESSTNNQHHISISRPFSIDLAPFLKSEIISHIFLQPLALWRLKRASVSRLHRNYAASDKDLSLASLHISLHTLADTQTLRFRFTVCRGESLCTGGSLSVVQMRGSAKHYRPC
jgi:hypothetical protein